MGCSEKLLNKELYFSDVRGAAETRGACTALAGSPSPSAALWDSSVVSPGPHLAQMGAASTPPAAFGKGPPGIGWMWAVL